MKKTQSKKYQSLSFAALLLGSASLASAQIADNNLNSFDSTAELAPGGSPPGFSNNNGTYGGGIWYGSSTVTWDGTQDNTGNGGGSAHIQSTWGLGQPNGDSPFEVYLGSISDQLYYIPSPIPLSQYLNVQFDFKWDNSSTMTLAQFNNLSLVPTNDLVNPNTPLNAAGQLEVYAAVNGGIGADIGGTAIPSAATNGWVHFTFPINATQAGLDGSLGIMLRPRNYFSTSANLASNLTAKFWIDNLFLKGTAAPPPPPTLSITKATPGLHFVAGSISGQFDRQNIITANGASSTANYSWAGATAGSPVTYSFTISKDVAPDLNFHIYFYQTAGAGGASAPDYNQPNVLIFQVSPLNAGTVSNNINMAVASLTWKTNSPSSGTTGTAITVSNTPLVGSWALQFTSATGGTIFAPGGNSYPFTIDPSLAVNIANPITVNFGINPAVNTNSILGEEVLVSQIGIQGVDPLSVDYSTNDNFLTDSVLDTNTWTVNALTPASVLFVTTNTPYSVNWILPDNGFGLSVTTNLAGLASGTDVGQPVISLFPGRRVLIPTSSLPAGKVAFFDLIKRTFTQLQVLLPGETNAPGTLSGKVGTPTPVSLGAGGFETVTINAVDSTWHIVNTSGDQITITTSDTSGITPNPSSLAGGTVQETLEFVDQGNWTVTATDSSNTNILSNASSSVAVGP
jgi:hypothetical protein